MDKPPGIEQFKIPGAAKKRNWLKMAPKIKRKGNAVEITEEYIPKPLHQRLTSETRACMTDFLTRLTPAPKSTCQRAKPTPVIVSNDQQEIKIYTTESHGRPLHQLSYYRGGKRERRSFADLNEAKREARIILGGLARDSIQAENLTAAEIESYTVARRILAPHNTPVHVAAEVFASAARAACPRWSPSMTLCATSTSSTGAWSASRSSELVEEYIRSAAGEGRDGSLSAPGAPICARFGKFTAGRMLPDLRARDLDDFLQQRPVGRDHEELACGIMLITFCRVGDRSRLSCRGTGASSTRAIAYQEPPTGRGHFHAARKWSGCSQASGRHLATPFLAIGAFAGLRSAEIERLDWKNVNLKRGFIEVRAETCKTRARRLVPISDNLRAWLKPFAVPAGPVVPYRAIAQCVMRTRGQRRGEMEEERVAPFLRVLPARAHQ